MASSALECEEWRVIISQCLTIKSAQELQTQMRARDNVGVSTNVKLLSPVISPSVAVDIDSDDENSSVGMF